MSRLEGNEEVNEIILEEDRPTWRQTKLSAQAAANTADRNSMSDDWNEKSSSGSTGSVATTSSAGAGANAVVVDAAPFLENHTTASPSPVSSNVTPNIEEEAEPDPLNISPLKLYDRESEQKLLYEAYKRCCLGIESKPPSSPRVPSPSLPGKSGVYYSSNIPGTSSALHPTLHRELVLVTGPSGTGKTALIVQTLKQRVCDKGGFFLSGKFDQLERPENYYPIVQAFTGWVHTVLVERDEATLRSIQEELKKVAETEQLLLDMIPALQQLLDVKKTSGLEQQQDGVDGNNRRQSFTYSRTQSNSSFASSSVTTTEAMQKARVSVSAGAQKRLIFAFCQFLQTICSPRRPMILFLDDLQWAEPASLNLLAALVGGGHNGGCDISHKNGSNPGEIQGLMIVGACRGNEVSMDHHLSVMLRELEADEHVTITHIPIGNLSCSAISQMLSQMLNKPILQSMPLAEIIHRRTGGNIFFVIQFLRALSEERLLFRRKDDGVWDWCAEAEMQKRLQDCSDSAVSLLAAKILRQPKPVQDIVMIAACIGAESDESILQVIVAFDVKQPLSVAEDKGLLHRRSLKPGSVDKYSMCTGTDESEQGRRWMFEHDQVQQAAYSLIPDHEREEVHLSIGRKLWRQLSPEQLHSNAFLVVNQLRMGARLMTDPDEREQMAFLLLQAGEKASGLSAFAAASSYLSLGIKLLGDRHWRDQYDLSLDLFNAAAEVAYCNSHFEEMDELINEVLKHARNDMDKSRALTASIYSLGTRNELQKAIDLGLQVLRGLGESFPSNPGVLSIIIELRRTKKRLKRFDNDADFLEMPLMRDAAKLSAMRIMNLLVAYAIYGRPLLAPLICMRLIHTTLDHGMSGMACYGFSAFALFLCTAFDDVPLGIRYARVGLNILDKFDAKEWLCRTYGAAHLFCFTFIQPCRDQLKPLLIAHRVGLGCGDIEYSMLCAGCYGALAINASIPLAPLYRDLMSFLELMILHKQTNMIQFCRPHLQVVMNLMGECEDPCALNGTAMNEKQAMKEAIDTKNNTSIALLLLLRLTILSYFQQYEKAEKVALELSKLNRDCFACFIKASNWLHEGLVSLALCSHRRRRRIRVAKRCLRNLLALAQHSDQTVASKVLLLEAEIGVFSGNFHQALETYELASSKAYELQLWNDAGLTHERAAHALRARGRDDESLQHLKKARAAYEKWGAHAKVAQIGEQIRSWFPVFSCE